MVERGFDQAHGLRRMFGAAPTRVLEIASGMMGVGRTSLAVNLGAALARSGRNTLLVDFVPQPAASRVHRYLGVMTAEGNVSPASALRIAEGFGVTTLAHRDWIQSGPLPARAFSTGGRGANASLHDWLLVNGTGVEPVVISEDGERDVLIVLSGVGASITDAYGLLKRVAVADPRCRFRVVVNRVHSPEAAHRIFANIAQVAQAYLNIPLDYIGCIPADVSVARAAAEGASVLESAPASAAAHAYIRLAEAIGACAGARPMRAAPAFDPSIALGAA